MTKHIANSLLSLIILSTMGHNREMDILYSTFDQLSVLISNLSTISMIGALTKGQRSKRQLFHSLRWPIYIFNLVDITKFLFRNLHPLY